ncbi:hypothetical protein ACI798_18700 [Geodermatophilus sp. SYSU D01045]
MATATTAMVTPYGVETFGADKPNVVHPERRDGDQGTSFRLESPTARAP